MLTISLPIYWTKTSKTKPSKPILVGMNWFRNANPYDQAAWKREFTELVLNQVTPFEQPLTLFKVHYQLYYKNPISDPSNIIALTEKIALDAFKKAAIITDDNCKYHLSSSWEVVSQDVDNPRVIVTILPA